MAMVTTNKQPGDPRASLLLTTALRSQSLIPNRQDHPDLMNKMVAKKELQKYFQMPPDIQVQYILQLCPKKTTIKTEQLIYPVTSLVADFGGTLGLFMGFSFISIWDNLALFGKSCKLIQK